MNFCDWFDIKNEDHLIAYKYLQEHGNWPDNFINFGHIKMENNWQLIIMSKMASEYVTQFFQNKKCEEKNDLYEAMWRESAGLL